MALTLDQKITKAWYEGAAWLFLLWPFSVVYSLVIRFRRYAYRSGMFKTYRPDIPVIVVGNITVGGTGKSPMVCYLVETLREQGFHPGIVSRGYGAKLGRRQVREVTEDSLASEVGDEPLMLKKRLACPVYVSPSRVLAAQALEKGAERCDVIVSDDGLQHYALARDAEICVFDGQRKWGNGHLLPMGPLREPIERIQSIPFLVLNGPVNAQSYGQAALDQTAFSMHLKASELVNLQTGETLKLKALKGQTVHALAAIGHPERFFQTLETAGLKIIPHVFADHHAYKLSDFTFKDASVLIMTEKDAVKCKGFELDNTWYLPVSARLNGDLTGQLIKHYLHKDSH